MVYSILGAIFNSKMSFKEFCNILYNTKCIHQFNLLHASNNNVILSSLVNQN